MVVEAIDPTGLASGESCAKGLGSFGSKSITRYRNPDRCRRARSAKIPRSSFSAKDVTANGFGLIIGAIAARILGRGASAA